tara:strand:+ start:572 stop:889 length:318 start_codon:yes stop_codon:yes gene_type:complete
MTHQINHAHLLTLTYKGDGKYTVTWNDRRDRKSHRRTLHTDNTNWHDYSGVTQEASEQFISWINKSSSYKKNEVVIKSITICGNGPDKYAIAVQTDFVPVDEVAA